MIRRTDKQKREDGLWDGSFAKAEERWDARYYRIQGQVSHMMQPSNIDRSTVTVRVPRKYYFLVRGFIAFLKLKARKDAKAIEAAEQEMWEFYEASADDRGYLGILQKGEKMVDVLRKQLP